MSEPPKDLEPDVLAVLLRAKPLTEVPDAAKQRMRAAVEARVAALPMGGNGSSAPGSWVASHPWISLSTVFLLGGALGAFARGALPERVVYVERAAAPPSAMPAPLPSRQDIPTVPVDDLPSAPVAPPRSAAAPSDSGQQLAAESALLDVARTAVARGEPDRALDAVDRHAKQFPHGLLAEEREALAIKALVLAGRGQEARDRAASFRERYPGSMFLRSIDASLATIR
jgi:hypothetical protein